MTFPPSKIGDKFNFLVAAYLKVRGIPELGSEFDPKNSIIDASPDRIPASSSLLEVSISFDIVVSKKKFDLLVECKHFESSKPIRKTTREFKEGMVEFIGSILLKNMIGYKTHKFLFVTNSKTNQLQNDLDELRTSLDPVLEKYIIELKDTATKKWQKANVGKINSSVLRDCLNDLKVITIEDGTLQSEYDKLDFKNEFNEIYSEVGRKIPNLPPNVPVDTSCIISCNDNEYVENRWNFLPVLISKKLVDWFKTQKPPEKIQEQSFEDIPFFEEMKIQTDDELSHNEITLAISSCINDEMKKTIPSIAVILNPSIQRIFLINPDWLFNKSSELRDPNYHFDLNKIKQSLSLPISGSLLRIAIQESYRLVGGSIVDETFFTDF